MCQECDSLRAYIQILNKMTNEYLEVIKMQSQEIELMGNKLFVKREAKDAR